MGGCGDDGDKKKLGWMAQFLSKTMIIRDINDFEEPDAAGEEQQRAESRERLSRSSHGYLSKYDFFTFEDEDGGGSSTAAKPVPLDDQEVASIRNALHEMVISNDPPAHEAFENSTPMRDLAPEARSLLVELPQLRGLRRCVAFHRGVTRHRCTVGRLTWLAHWIGDDPRNAQARTRLLARIWNDVRHFRPFTTIGEAVALVESQENEIVIRLSSTVPGCISVSYCGAQKKARHRRFAIRAVRARSGAGGRSQFRSAVDSAAACSGYLLEGGDRDQGDDDGEGDGTEHEHNEMDHDGGATGDSRALRSSRDEASLGRFVSGYISVCGYEQVADRPVAAREPHVCEEEGVGLVFEQELSQLYGTTERFEGYIEDPATSARYFDAEKLARAVCSPSSSSLPSISKVTAQELRASEYYCGPSVFG